jgi:hypothetical protein
MVVKCRLFDKLQLPELQELMIFNDELKYDAREVNLDTWNSLSQNCPKLMQIYQVTATSTVDYKIGYIRKIVAKRLRASGLIRKMRPKIWQWIDGETNPLEESLGLGSYRCEFDSSDGEEDTN